MQTDHVKDVEVKIKEILKHKCTINGVTPSDKVVRLAQHLAFKI